RREGGPRLDGEAQTGKGRRDQAQDQGEDRSEGRERNRLPGDGDHLALIRRLWRTGRIRGRFAVLEPLPPWPARRAPHTSATRITPALRISAAHFRRHEPASL